MWKNLEKDILPSWEEIDEKKRANIKLDAIELFIYENEPAKEDEEFRKMFIEALYFWSGVK